MTMERSLRATGIANAATLSVSHTMAAPSYRRAWCKLQIARRNTYFINAQQHRRQSFPVFVSLFHERSEVYLYIARRIFVSPLILKKSHGRSYVTKYRTSATRFRKFFRVQINV